MWSFTSTQIIHDQLVKEALERSRVSRESKTDKPHGLHMMREVLSTIRTRLSVLASAERQAEPRLIQPNRHIPLNRPSMGR